MQRLIGAALTVLIGSIGSSGCTGVGHRDGVEDSHAASGEIVLVWAVSARECVSCQMDAHSLRQILSTLKVPLVVQRREADASVVDGFLRRERISSEAVDTRTVRVGASGGAWTVVTGGRVTAREDYSLNVRGDGLRALRVVSERAGLVPSGTRTGEGL